MGLIKPIHIDDFTDYLFSLKSNTNVGMINVGYYRPDGVF